MNLYHFNPNDYGHEYFIMSETIHTAIDEFNKYVSKKQIIKSEIA